MWIYENRRKWEKMENFKRRKKLWLSGNLKINSLMRHLTSFETTATAAFRLVISMRSNLSYSHCIIVMVGAIQGCYGDCSSWQHRGVIFMIAHPYSSGIEHACCYSTQVSVCCNKHVYVAQRWRVLTQPRQKQQQQKNISRNILDDTVP